MVVNESTILGPDGVTVVARIVDNGDGTGVRYDYAADGSVTGTQALTDLPVFTWTALDATGALATLLVVQGVLPLQDAANAVHEEPEHLQAEALAWEAASTPPV